MDLDRSNPDPRASLARLYLAQGNKAGAEQFLKQSKSDFPNNSAGYRMLGDFYFATGDLDKALAEYETLYKQHASDPQVKKNYVQLLIMKGRDAEAQGVALVVLHKFEGDLGTLARIGDHGSFRR